MPANGGKPRYMKCNMEEMNSWHSWSPNSRWLVFSSKNKGLYTQLYLTHIDKNGNDSPPVLLENLRFSKRAANIPEFFLGDSKKFFKIKDSFSKTAPYYSATVIDNILNKYYVRAWNNLQKALEIDSLYDEAYFQRITLNALLQQVNSDFDKKDKEFLLKIINKQLAKNTNNENLLLIKATLLSSYGKTDEAIKLAEDIINKYPSSFKTYELICSIYRKTKQYQKAISLYDKMIKLFPINKEQLELLKASAYGELKRYNEALNIFNFYLNKYPTDIGLYSSKAVILMNQRRLNEAFECIKEIGKIDSTSSNYNMLITEYYKLTGNELLSSFYQKRTLKAYKKELEENPENIDIIFKLAESYQKMNNLKEAEYYYNLVLRYFPYNYKALSQKARIKLQLQQWDDAISV